MSLDLVTLHAQALDRMGKTFRNIAKTQWHNATPDTEWDVRTLANHIVSENFWVAPLLAGQTVDDIGDRFEGDLLGDNPAQRFAISATQAQEAVASDGALQTKVQLSYGKVPAEIYIKQRLLDLVVHNWDLSVGTKQHARLDIELVDAALQIVDEQRDELLSSGLFGNELAVSEDATPQTKLLATLGRAEE